MRSYDGYLRCMNTDKMDKLILLFGWIGKRILKRVININLIFRHNYITQSDPLVYKENREIVRIHIRLD